MRAAAVTPPGRGGGTAWFTRPGLIDELHRAPIARFHAARLDPAQPESQHQNTVVMHALASSVRAFADRGYQAYLDDIIGPWFPATGLP